MSSNLLKRSDTQLLTQNKIIIDVNKRFRPLRQEDAHGAETASRGAGTEEAGAGELSGETGAEEALRKGADEEARAILEGARAEAEEILEHARVLARQERETAVSEGREAGYREGLELARAEQARMEARLEERRMRLEEEYEELLERLEPDMVDALCGIYEHVFKVELRSYRDVLLHLIGSAMRKVESTKSFLIHVSSDDYPYVSMQKKILPVGSVAGNGTVEVLEDVTLAKGQCMIETDGGIFDCGLGTQMEELHKRLTLLAYQRDA